MLARRELSEAQIRQRLTRQRHDADTIDAAVERLKTERALDDARTAAAIARTELSVKRRGKLRVTRQIESAGIASSVAKRAADEAFAEVDDLALLEAALGRRLRGREQVADQREFQRVYRYLVSQGFEPDRVLNALRRRRPAAR
jgi:regulatory protein